MRPRPTAESPATFTTSRSALSRSAPHGQHSGRTSGGQTRRPEGPMRAYGVPEEVLTDNGKVFTGRFHKPGVPVEVLFDRICRENGITHRLTKIHSPTTTGKIERLHQTLQRELLDVHGPFASIEALQAALEAWRAEYNTGRPHQSLSMAFPASRFTPASLSLELRIPAQLTVGTGQPEPPPPAPGSLPPQSLPVEAAPQPAATTYEVQPAVE